MTRRLHEEDVGKLLDLLTDCSGKWYEIGVALGFTTSELRQIMHSQSTPMSALDCFRELLIRWIQRPTSEHSTEPTLRALCSVLRDRLGLEILAETIMTRMKYSPTGSGKVTWQLETCKLLLNHNYILCMVWSFRDW